MKLFFAWVLAWIPALLTGQENAPLYYRMTPQDFFNLPDVNQSIDLLHPDYELLDAALFHATNEVRVSAGLPPFKYAAVLFQSASFHAVSMIERNFYDHYNKTGPAYATPTRRIQTFGGKYHITAENIAQLETIDSPHQYCPRKGKDGLYQYFNCNTGKACRPYTYLSFARRALRKWMASPGHRANILNTDLTFMACAARLSRNPYRARNAPFARPVQNFGGYITTLQRISSK